MKHLKFFVFLCILTFTVSCGQQKRYIQYKVQEGETMSRIAQKLDMKTKDLLRLNPDVDDEPSANDFIVVPEKKLKQFKDNLIKKEETINGIIKDSVHGVDDLEEDIIDELNKKYVVYEVKKGDTYYGLKKAFDVTRGELLVLNPELKEGLKPGQILKIKEIPAEIITDEIFYDDYIDRGTALKVALLLPFRTDKYNYDTIRLKNIFTQNAALVNIATDLYLGAELAIDSLRKKGLDIEFNVYDTGNRSSNELNRIISREEVKSSDVIIGPLYSEEIQTVAANVNVPVVFPVYSKSQSEFYQGNIIKTSPDKRVFREELQRYILENFDEGNIIIVGDATSESIQTSNAMKYVLESGSITNPVHILTPNNGYIEKSKFLRILKPAVKNWVIIATDNNVIVSDAINSLISLPENTTAKVFAFDKSAAYDRVDNLKLGKIGFTYVSEEYVDENSEFSKAFNSQYYKKNNALPSYYATKGFDITYDILIRLASGNDLKTTLQQGMSSRVETKFDFRNSSNNSENQGLFIIQYNKDLSLTKLK